MVSASPIGSDVPVGRKGVGIVAIGASTGGPRAIEFLLTALPPDIPGIIVALHMPGSFTELFARRLDAKCPFAVSLAKSDDRVQNGRVLIAPGDRHVQVRRSGGEYTVELMNKQPYRDYCPSVNLLFRSLAREAGSDALGLILTGMGNDGAAGLLEMRRAGADTMAQDEKSCLVFGMPREAIDIGAVEEIHPLDRLPQVLSRRFAAAHR